ncbi:hypothetical protein [Pseudofrankia sp. DC12]|uniref:hypothetical protein n=1 Tax=Pseudofrankia sp. DC12 TaxID=683315 RepID=UPI0005F7654B|nr:hypothetical protein [Pseudofrankia sp. DC12]
MPTDDRGRLLSDDGAWVWDAGSHQWLPHALAPVSPGPSAAASRDDFFAVERVDEAAASSRSNGTRADTDWVIGGSAGRPRTDGVVDPFAVSASRWDRDGSDSGLSVTGIDVGPAAPVAGPAQVTPPGYGTGGRDGLDSYGAGGQAAGGYTPVPAPLPGPATGAPSPYGAPAQPVNRAANGHINGQVYGSPSAVQTGPPPVARSWPARPSGGTAADPTPASPAPQRPGPVSGPVRLGPTTGSVRVGGDPLTTGRTHPAASGPTSWNAGLPGQPPGAAAGPAASPVSAPAPAPLPAPPVSPAPNIFFTPARGLPVNRPAAEPSSGQTAAAASEAAARVANPWRPLPGQDARAGQPDATASPWRTPTVDGLAGRAGGLDPYAAARTAPPPVAAPSTDALSSGVEPPGIPTPGIPSPHNPSPHNPSPGSLTRGTLSPGAPASRGTLSGDPARVAPGFDGALGDPVAGNWRTPARPGTPQAGGQAAANGQWRRRTGGPVIDPRDPLGTGGLPSSRPVTSARTGPPPQRPSVPGSPSLPVTQFPLPATGSGRQPAAPVSGPAAPSSQPAGAREPRGQGAGRRGRRSGQNDPTVRGAQNAAGDAVQDDGRLPGAQAYGVPGYRGAPFDASPVGPDGNGRPGGAERPGPPPVPVEMTSVLSRAVSGGRAGRDLPGDLGRPHAPAEQPGEPRPRRGDAPATDLLDPVRPGAAAPAPNGQPGRAGQRRHTASRSGTGPAPGQGRDEGQDRGERQGRDEGRRNSGLPADRGGAAGQTGGYRGGEGERPDEARPARDDLADLLEPAVPQGGQEPPAGNGGQTGTRRRFATEDLSDLQDEVASRRSSAGRGAHGGTNDRLTWFRHGWLGPLAVAVTLALVALGLYVLVSGRGGGARGGGSVVATTPPGPAGTNPDAKVGKALVDGTYTCQAGPAASAPATTGTAGATVGAADATVGAADATAITAGTSSILIVPATTGTYTWNGQSGAYAIATPNYDDASNIIASVSFSTGPLQGDIATSIADWPKGGGRVTATVTLTKGNTMFCKLN